MDLNKINVEVGAYLDNPLINQLYFKI